MGVVAGGFDQNEPAWVPGSLGGVVLVRNEPGPKLSWR